MSKERGQKSEEGIKKLLEEIPRLFKEIKKGERYGNGGPKIGRIETRVGHQKGIVNIVFKPSVSLRMKGEEFNYLEGEVVRIDTLPWDYTARPGVNGASIIPKKLRKDIGRVMKSLELKERESPGYRTYHRKRS